jgi:hypothetical protein
VAELDDELVEALLVAPLMDEELEEELVPAADNPVATAAPVASASLVKASTEVNHGVSVTDHAGSIAVTLSAA